MSQPLRPSPVRRVWVRSAIRATRSSPTPPTATTALIAMQRSPAEPNPEFTAASAARSRSASGSTTMWFFAPPRACTRLPCRVPVSYTYWAIAVEPTKDTDWMSGCSSSRSTATLSPWTTLNTPSGSPASFHSSAIHSDADGSCSLGLRTTVLPVAIAMGKNHIGTITGKLNGLMIATGPSGLRTEWTSTLVEAFSVKPPRTSEGTPQAYSTTSWPRETSPRASSRTLPCSAVMIAASSGLRALSSSRKRKSTAVRLAREVSRQRGKAAVAAATGASTSSVVASGTSPMISPVAESVTSPVRPLAPSRRAPSIQCGMEVGMVPLSGVGPPSGSGVVGERGLREVRPGRAGRGPGGGSGCVGVGERPGGEVLADQPADRVEHAGAGLAGLVVPAEDAGGEDAVEVDPGQGGEGLVEVVDAADHVQCRQAELDEVVRVRLQRQLDALPLEDRQQLLHRPPEHRLGELRCLRPAVELRVHRVHAEFDADLDGPLPVADGGLPLHLDRARPAHDRQQRGDAHAGVGQPGLERPDGGGVHPRVLEERDEVLAGRELDPLVAHAGHHVGQLEQRDGAQHLRVQGDPHDCVPPRDSSRTSVRCPERSASTPAAHTAWAAYPSQAPGPSTSPRRAASTQRCSPMS